MIQATDYQDKEADESSALIHSHTPIFSLAYRSRGLWTNEGRIVHMTTLSSTLVLYILGFSNTISKSIKYI